MASDADGFRAFVTDGQRLAESHVHDAQQHLYPLVEEADEKLDHRVTSMNLSKDKTSLGLIVQVVAVSQETVQIVKELLSP